MPQAPAEGTVVRIRDLAGRRRGTGFLVDDEGTVLTSHEAVDGLPCAVLHIPGEEHTWLVERGDVVPLPESDLAVVRVRGLAGRPFVLAAAAADAGAEVDVRLPRRRLGGRVTGGSTATYTATDRFHLVEGTLQLDLEGQECGQECGGEVSGAPVLDAASGAVVAVLGTALHAERGGVAFAVPVRGAADDAAGTLAGVLERNGVAVAAYGRDLNLAGVLQLGAGTFGAAEGSGQWCEPVERADVAGEYERFRRGDALVLGLVGDPGTGRSTELAGLAARRTRGAEPAPTVCLRGADLKVADGGLQDAVARALAGAARVVAAAAGAEGTVGDPAAATAEAVAGIARAAGEPLLVLLDAPEEMPPVLAHSLADWTARTAEWLCEHGVRLVLACRPEYWEQAGALFPAESLHGEGGGTLPPCVRLGDLTPGEAELARARYAIPEGALGPADARHPLALRLLAELGRAGGLPSGVPRRWELYEAYLALVCLRVAARLAAEAGPGGPRGAAVGRLAARVAGQVHEAARRSLGPGQGELERASFEELFPWRTGWASAVLTEGLMIPAGAGYRFAHEEFADWLQGMHLDVDAALAVLVHRVAGPQPPAELPARAYAGAAAGTLPVPRHRIGPCIEALLLLERRRGHTELAHHLADLLEAVDAAARRQSAGERAAGDWWAAHLLGETLLRVPDATPYVRVLRLLAVCIGTHATGVPVLAPFGPGFFTRLPLPLADRLDLLRLLVPADARRPSAFLVAAGELLRADPGAVQPLLTEWFGDGRALPAEGATVATVADAAQALLHTHRGLAVDELLDALVAAAHPRADELLAALAEDEPSAMCRAVDRWARDHRVERQVAAATYALKAARHARSAADRELLRYAAQALLSQAGDGTLYGPALAVLVRDPESRNGYLAHALSLFTDDDPHIVAADFTPALETHPEPVLDAFRTRLHQPGSGAAEVLRTLAGLRTPAAARRAAELVREYLAHRPEGAPAAAEFVDRRLEHGQTARAVLFPLAVELLTAHPPAVRRALAPVVAAPGSRASRPLRRELLAVVLDRERDPGVLDALLTAVARGAARRAGWRTRDMVQRIGLLLTRTPEGAAGFDRSLVALVRELPGFGELVRGWLAEEPAAWAALLGPSAQHAVGAARRAG